MENDIEELKASSDVILLHFSEIQARVATVTQMILDVYKETLPVETYRVLYTNYVDSLEENMNNAFSAAEKSLFDAGAPLLRHKFEVFSAIQNLKRNSLYFQTASDDNTR